MRLEFHCGRSHTKKGEPKSVYNDKHNDRNFDITKEQKGLKINPDLTPYNTYINHIGTENETFADTELRYYEEHFRAALDSYNATKIKRRHAKDCKTMEQFKSSPQYAPEEYIIQVGNTRDRRYMTAEKRKYLNDSLIEGVNQFMEWHNSRFSEPVNGCHIDFLNAAIHVDEIKYGKAVPHHAHIRSCFIALDSKGNEIPAEDKCLAAFGYKPYDLPPVTYIDEKTGEEKTEITTVTRKMQYTAECRQKLLDIYSGLGLDMAYEPKERGESGLSHEAYITQVLTAEKEQAQTELDNIKQQITQAKDELAATKQTRETIREQCRSLARKTKDEADEYYSGRMKQAIDESKEMTEQIKTDSKTVSDAAAQAQALFVQYQAAINKSCSDEAAQLKKYMQQHKYKDGTTFYERYQQEQQQNKDKINAYNNKFSTLSRLTNDISSRYMTDGDEYQR